MSGWQDQEKRIAKAVGGRRRAASGAFWSGKGDVRSPDLLIEAKWTALKQIVLKAEHLEKIFGEAVIEGRIPVLGIHMNRKNYVVLTEEDFLEMRDRRV